MTPAESRRDLLLALYVPSAILAFSRALILPVLPRLALDLDASYGMVGVVLAAQWVGTLIMDVPVGVAIRRIGRKRIMLLGVGLVSASALALVWAQSLMEVVAYRFITGMGMALWGIARHAFLAEAIRVEQRGRASATMGGMARITAFAAPLPGGLISECFGLRVPFVVCAVLGALAFVATARWVRADAASPVDVSRNGPASHFAAVLRDQYRILLAAGSGALCAQMIRAGRGAIVPLYGYEMLGLGESAMGLVISISYGVDMLLFYPAGLLMDRFGRKFAYVPSFVVQAVGMALMPLATGFYGLLAVVALIGLGNGIGAGTMLTLGSDLAPEHARAEFLGIWRFIGDGGHAGGPIVVGEAADLIGLGPAPLVIAGIGLLGAAILGLFVPETLKRSETPSVA